MRYWECCWQMLHFLQLVTENLLTINISEVNCNVKYTSFLHSGLRLQKGNQNESRWDCMSIFFSHLKWATLVQNLVTGFISDMWQETWSSNYLDSASLTTLSFGNLLIYKWGLSPLLNELRKDMKTAWETRHNNQFKCCYYFMC